MSDSIDEWEILEEFPVWTKETERHCRLSRDDEFFEMLLDGCPMESDWLVLPEDAIAVVRPRRANFMRFLRANGGNLDLLPLNILKEISRNILIPTEMRKRFWLRLLHFHIENFPETVQDIHETNCSSEVIYQIDKDIPRTNPEIIDTNFHDSLRRVLINFASINQSIGYCQGLNYIASIFLQIGMTEAESLKGLTCMVIAIGKDFHHEDLPGIHRVTLELMELIRLYIPWFLNNLKRTRIPLQWLLVNPLICMFARNFSFHAVARIWDVLLSEGSGMLTCIMLSLFELAGNSLDIPLEVDSCYDLEKSECPIIEAHALFQRKVQALASSEIERILSTAYRYHDLIMTHADNASAKERR